MSSTVVVHMKTCGKVNEVTAELQDDGTISVRVVSNCPNVQAYAERLRTVTVEDVTNYEGSKVVNPEIRATLSVPCLTPIAVFDAAWMELGLLSKNRAKDVGCNDVSFEMCDKV